MVVIDGNDVGKSREQVLLYLIYEASGQIIPLDKVEFGKPRILDQRKDLDTDPNTFIPCRISQEYDDRYWAEGSGFMYRRRCILNHTQESDLHSVRPAHLPFTITEILPLINAILPYPIQSSDVIDYKYNTLEEVRAGITLQAHPESLLWINGKTFTVNTDILEGAPLIDNRNLDGFNEYSPPV